MRRVTPSLRLRLALATVAVLGASLCAFSLLLHATFSRALSRQFQDTLAADARAVANLAEATPRRWLGDRAGRAGGPGQEPGAPLRSRSGRWMAPSSPSSKDLGEHSLPREPELDAPGGAQVPAPQGQPALLYEANELSRRGGGRSQRVTVAVARGTGELDSVTRPALGDARLLGGGHARTGRARRDRRHPAGARAAGRPVLAAGGDQRRAAGSPPARGGLARRASARGANPRTSSCPGSRRRLPASVSSART